MTLNFARFPETPTDIELTGIVPTRGSCVENAVEVDSPRLLCQADGNWTLPSGGCKCMAGYEPIGQTCQGKFAVVDLICTPSFDIIWTFSIYKKTQIIWFVDN